MSILSIVIAAATEERMHERLQERPRKEEIPPFIMQPPERRPSTTPSPTPTPAEEASRSARTARETCKAKPKSSDKERTPAKKAGGDAKQSQRNAGCGERTGASAAKGGAGSTEGMRAADAEYTASDFDADHGAQDFAVLKRNDGGERFLTDGGNSDFDNGDMANNVFGQSEKEPFATSSAQAPFSSSSDGKMDFEPLMDKLMPMTGDDGIFEVVLTNGETMGVVVNSQATQISFFLSPSTAQMSELLSQRPQQMELESRLERRIRRNVKITVL